MIFSPYTLNSHIFTGGGVELKPDGWEFAAMYGRLSKAVEYDETHPFIPPAYKRMGYGMKAGRTGKQYQISVNVFNASDNAHSLAIAPDSLGVTPVKNLAGSILLLFKPVKFIEIGGEYGISLLTADTRAAGNEQDGTLSAWSDSNISSSYYHAYKASLSYAGGSNRFGLAYERIDPGYRTLGAYYFVNDIENITVNLNQSFWQNKVNVSASVGFEHDDLASTKATGSSRTVGSANLTVAPSDKLNIGFAYSNFQTYTNVRSAFETINMENPLDKLDTLNFVQLSQSASLNLSFIPKITEKHSHHINMTVSYQDAANKQGGVYHTGSVTEMVNSAAAYSLTFLKTATNSSVAFSNL